MGFYFQRNGSYLMKAMTKVFLTEVFVASFIKHYTKNIEISKNKRHIIDQMLGWIARA